MYLQILFNLKKFGYKLVFFISLLVHDQVVNMQRKTHVGIELPTSQRMTFGAGFHHVS